MRQLFYTFCLGLILSISGALLSGQASAATVTPGNLGSNGLAITDNNLVQIQYSCRRWERRCRYRYGGGGDYRRCMRRHGCGYRRPPVYRRCARVRASCRNNYGFGRDYRRCVRRRGC